MTARSSLSSHRVRDPVLLYAVRHAKAGDRTLWNGPDDVRPLTRSGLRQADALVDLFAPWSIEHVSSSPYLRCMQTVEPLAAACGKTVTPAGFLAEGAAPSAVSRELARLREATVWCTHGDVVGALLAFAEDCGIDLGRAPRLAKASTWILEIESGLVRAARYVAPPGD